MDNELVVREFNFESNVIRTTVDDDGKLWVVAKDVALALEYSWNGADTVSHVPEEWKGVRTIHTPGGNQQMQCLTEEGLNFFTFRSDKPKALPFQKWLAGEVLPSIRKTGTYAVPEKSTEVQLAEAVLLADGVIKKQKATIEHLAYRDGVRKQKMIEDRPKVRFANAITASESTILIGQLAKLLNQNGVDIGQNRLFGWLREKGYLVRQKGDNHNLPTQISMDKRLMQIKKGKITTPDGSVKATTTTVITGVGQQYFINKFLTNYEKDK